MYDSSNGWSISNFCQIKHSFTETAHIAINIHGISLQERFIERQGCLNNWRSHWCVLPSSITILTLSKLSLFLSAIYCAGICFAIAKAMGRHGASIAIMGRRREKLDEALVKLRKESIPAICVQGDVRNYQNCQNAVQQTVERFGRLDILVNGAAGNFLCPAEEVWRVFQHSPELPLCSFYITMESP